jgi:hypothetical protein
MAAAAQAAVEVVFCMFGIATSCQVDKQLQWQSCIA